MKKLTKITVLSLIILLIVGLTGLFTACDDGNGESPKPSIPTYDVRFINNYPDGGNPEIANVIKVQENKSIPQTSVKEPTRPAGYVFGGWYTTKDCTEIFDLSKKITEDTKIYAKWDKNGLSVDTSFIYENKFNKLTEEIAYFEDGERKIKEVDVGEYIYKGENTDGTVPIGTKSFNFTTKLSGITHEKSTFEVFKDKDCKRPASDSGNNIVTLNRGDNYYYVKITAEDTIATAVYKINIVLESKYTVILDKIHLNSQYREIITASYGDKISAPDLTGLYPGHVPVGWTYQPKEKRDENNNIVDAKGNILQLKNGVYYIVNSSGNKYPIYKDKENNIAVREGDKYYKTDKKGNIVYENNQKVEIQLDDLANVLENGLPIYETSEPVIPSTGGKEFVWDFDKCTVTDDVVIFCDWVESEYTLTLNLGDPLASYDGTTTLKVKYDTAAFALGEKIKQYGSGIPVHPFATFQGWYYDDMLMVDSTGEGVSEWKITSDAVFTAKWKLNSYDVIATANDSTMGIVEGSGKCVYNGTILLMATPNTGYEFVNWTIADKEVSKSASFNYALNLNDLKNKKINIVANFKLVSVKLSIDYQLESNEVKPESWPNEIVANYGSLLYNENNGLPIISDKSPNNTRLFVGWYYLNASNEKVYLTNKNTPLENNESWTILPNTALNNKLYVDWNPNNYQVSLYKALYNGKDMGELNYGVHFTDIEDVIIIKGSYDLMGRTVSKILGTEFSFSVSVNNDEKYQFIGWYKINNMYLEDLFSIEDNYELLSDELSYEFTLEEQNVSIVALWYYKPVNVQLILTDSNDNEIGSASISVDFDKLYKIEPDKIEFLNDELQPVPFVASEGFYFDGWFKNTLKYADKNGNSLNTISDEFAITEGITLRTKWLPINYFIVNNGIITGLTNDGLAKTELSVPKDDYIHTIAPYAFKGNNTIKSITIYGNITSIGEQAFAESNVESILFEGEFKGITIKSGALQNCIKLTTVHFPDGTELIEDGALLGCYKLTSITFTGEKTLGSLFTNYNPDNSSWYSAEQNGVTYWLPRGLETINISNRSESLADYAFANCIFIKTVNLSTPKGDKKFIKRLGNYSFAGTGNVAINMNNVESIGYYAFLNSGIISINIDNVSDISDSAFKGSKLTSIDFSNTIIDTVPSYCFQNCTDLASVNIGRIKYIGAYAFYGCTSVSSIGAINVVSAREYAFYNTALNKSTVSSEFAVISDVGRYAFHETNWYRTSVQNKETMIVGHVLYLFNNATSIDSFINNKSINIIGAGAFENATLGVNNALNLSAMTELTRIESYAFANSDILSIVLPASLIEIKNNTFNGCASLQSVDMNACVNLTKIGIRAFLNNTSLNNVIFFNNINTDDDLKNSVKLTIAKEAFKGCTNLSAITLPPYLSSIGEYIFADCNALQTVNFVKNDNYEKPEEGEAKFSYYLGLIKSISKGAFMNTAIETIEIPWFISEIQSYAFYNCQQLIKVNTQPESGNIKSLMVSIGENAFANDKLFTGITVSNTFNKLGAGAFLNCEKLEKFISNISIVPDYAFSGCVNLSQFVSANTISAVGEKAFLNCIQLRSITAKIKDVGAYAFKNCTKLTNVSLEGSLIIGQEAFKSCTAIESVLIPSSVVDIGAGAFSECTSLNQINLNLATNLETIGTSAFAGCMFLNEIVLPENVNYIGASSFANCKALEKIVINAGVEYIGEEAFANCNSLTITMLGADVPVLGGDLFNDTASFVIRVMAGYKNKFVANEDWAIYAENIVEFTVA